MYLEYLWILKYEIKSVFLYYRMLFS
jgi:hypothetical protein